MVVRRNEGECGMLVVSLEGEFQSKSAVGGRCSIGSIRSTSCWFVSGQLEMTMPTYLDPLGFGMMV